MGDEVVICGELMNYRGNTPETVSNAAYLYSLNGEGEGGGGGDTPTGEAKGTGTLDDPYNALGAANAVKGLSWTSNTEYQSTGDVYIKGKISISRVRFPASPTRAPSPKAALMAMPRSTFPTTERRPTSSIASGSCIWTTRSSRPARPTSRWVTK